MKTLALFVLAALLVPWTAVAERRVALVIGNSAYVNAPALPNPARDAQALGARLRQLGFDVESAFDQNKTGMDQALRRFGRKVSGADVALLFYAGHGFQIADRNYLVPVDAKLEQESDIRFETVELRDAIEVIQSNAKAGIVLLDACRNNPLASRIKGRTRAMSRGLAVVETGTGELLVVYATSPGMTADDGDGGNSPFTTALLDYIGTPGIEVQTVVKRVIGSVQKQTGGRQVPWQLSSLTSEIYLGGSGGMPQVAVEPPRPIALPAATPVPVPASRPAPMQSPAHVAEKPAPRASIATRSPAPVGSFVPVESGAERNLHAIWTSSPNDVWIGGEDTFLRWNGSTWSDVPIKRKPAMACGISGTGPNDIWLRWNKLSSTSKYVELQHFNGRTWMPVPGATDGVCDYAMLESLHHGFWSASPNDLWWVNGLVFHGDGTTWTALQGITGEYVWGTSSSDVWVWGGGDWKHWNGTKWIETRKTSTGLSLKVRVFSMWGTGPNDVWAVGKKRTEGGYAAAIIHWDGTRWSEVIENPDGTRLLSVWGSGPRDVWAVGGASTVDALGVAKRAGLIMHWDGEAWDEVASGTTQTLVDIAGSGPDNIWVVGEKGTVLRYVPPGAKAR